MTNRLHRNEFQSRAAARLLRRHVRLSQGLRDTPPVAYFVAVRPRPFTNGGRVGGTAAAPPAAAAGRHRRTLAPGAPRDAVAGGKERLECALNAAELAQVAPAQVDLVGRGALVDAPRDDLMGVRLVLLRNLPAADVAGVGIHNKF